jgi:hypothetical protein
MLVPATPEELALHRAAIDRIRKRLFSKHSTADYWISDGSEKIHPPSAQLRWNAACGEYREFTLGGLSYAVDCLDRHGLTQFTVRHQQNQEFAFWMENGKGNATCSLVVPFRVLDEVVFRYVVSCRRANAGT